MSVSCPLKTSPSLYLSAIACETPFNVAFFHVLSLSDVRKEVVSGAHIAPTSQIPGGPEKCSWSIIKVPQHIFSLLRFFQLSVTINADMLSFLCGIHPLLNLESELFNTTLMVSMLPVAQSE